MNKFNVGQRVIINDDGYMYPTSTSIASSLNLNRYVEGFGERTCMDTEYGRVVSIAPPDLIEEDEIIYGIYLFEHDVDIVIAENGLLADERLYFSIDDDLFTI